jgi:putative membrane protein
MGVALPSSRPSSRWTDPRSPAAAALPAATAVVPVPVNLTNELARQRNRDAAERTLMAWIRTCLSLISFGFGLDKIVAAIDRATGSAGPRSGVIAVALAFVFTGILSMAVATVEHLRELKRLRRDDFVYVETPRLAAATATLITLIGVMAMGILITGLVR